MLHATALDEMSTLALVGVCDFSDASNTLQNAAASMRAAQFPP